MTLSDWLNVLAILLSPLIALQVSRRLDERKERKQHKMWVFYTLMATRNARVSVEHVRALNSIDIEFVKVKAVTDAWKAYLDHLNDRSLAPEVWGARSDELFVELLFAMSQGLGFEFDKVHLKRGIYSPVAHGQDAEDLKTIREALVKIAKGERGLRVDLSDIVHTADEETAADETKKAAREVITGVRPLRVKIERDEPPAS